MAIWTPQHRPTYKQGFARYPAEARYPGLWKGLVGAWFPSLGPTGLTLRDIGGFGNHGTLTNMDPATDWVLTEKGYTLQFDGVTQYTTIPYIPTMTGPSTSLLASVMVWFRFSAAPASRAYLWSQCNPLSSIENSNTVGLALNTSRSILAAREGIGPSTTVAPTDQWNQAVGMWQTGALRWAGLNGILTSGGGDGSVAGMTYGAVGAMRLVTPAYFFPGEISSIMIWARLLTPSEIQLLYEEPNALVMQRQRVYPAAVAVVGYTVPLSHILENSA